ncbi:MAG: iron-containing alcohol dehydrogenase [Xanthobacteraceae bacterium]
MLTLGLPPYATATCGFDVLTHAIEAYSSARATPYSDAIALQAIAMVVRHPPPVLTDGRDIEARAQMMLASSMAAMAFNVAGLGAAHGTGHALSARLNIAHGQTLATMLPHVMSYNLDVRIEKYAKIAEALGVASSDALARTMRRPRSRRSSGFVSNWGWKNLSANSAGPTIRCRYW